MKNRKALWFSPRLGCVCLIGVKYEYPRAHQHMRSLKELQAMQTNPDSPIRVSLI